MFRGIAAVSCAALVLAAAIALWPAPSPSSAHVAAIVAPERHPAALTRREAVHRKRLARHHVVRPALDAQTTVLDYPPPPVRARAGILEDVDSGKILFAQNADARLPMASTTKITTAAVVLDRARLNALVPVSQRAATVGEATMVLQRGERLTVRQLLYGMLLNSANDAAVALAEYVGGTEARFVAMMNALARHLGMTNTHYVTPHGLDEPNHYTSARDLATIARYALSNPTFRAIVATSSYHIPATRHNHEHWLANINRVLFWYPGVDGVKPGSTDAAGWCQVVSAWRNGRHVLAVLLNTPTMVFDIRNLLDYGSRDFQWVQAPAFWDAPADSLSGGSGRHQWLYYYGAGHYIRGLFLSYFETHGGLQTLGYPRTDEMMEQGVRVQFFEGGELAYDPAHHSVYPVDVGDALATAFAPRSLPGKPAVDRLFAGLFTRLGGAGVFGWPRTSRIVMGGNPTQLFQYGGFTLAGGVPAVLPAGDAMLRMRGWLPARGAADSYPATMNPGSVATIRALLK